MYTQQDFELIFTDSRVNNIGIWIENSSQIRVREVLKGNWVMEILGQSIMEQIGHYYSHQFWF